MGVFKAPHTNHGGWDRPQDTQHTMRFGEPTLFYIVILQVGIWYEYEESILQPLVEAMRKQNNHCTGSPCLQFLYTGPAVWTV